MSYVILGRTVKTEYMALATLCSTGLIAYASMGGKKEAPPAAGKSLTERVKEVVPINAGSSEEERFINNFIAEAEKEAKH